MKIAIVGAGISGLTLAYLLHPRYEITVYESNHYLGGHTATVDVEIDNRPLSVDTGFIVFNDWTYPKFVKLVNTLDVPYKTSEMGFSVTTRNSAGDLFEYCGSSLNALFAQRSNLLKPPFYKMIVDIVAFNRQSKKDLEFGRIPADMSLGFYLRQFEFGSLFLNRYIIPMASAIWSSSCKDVNEFNAQNFIRFLSNHGLLNLSNRPQWHVIVGGSRNYIGPLVSAFKDRIRVGDGVKTVQREKNRVSVLSEQGTDSYDQIVMACHSDQALNLLSNPSQSEKEVLLGIPYRQNSVVLHTDESVLPRSRRAWASWNYLLDGHETTQPVLTYNMNILQGLDSKSTVCVSVNADRHIAKDRIIRSFNYAHPQFGKHSVQSQAGWDQINGHNRSWYCGAYWGNGFHEDGVVSALRVADALGGVSL